MTFILDTVLNAADLRALLTEHAYEKSEWDYPYHGSAENCSCGWEPATRAGVPEPGAWQQWIGHVIAIACAPKTVDC